MAFHRLIIVVHKTLAAFLFSLVLLAASAYASHYIIEPLPKNGSFFGRGSVNFSINVTNAALDTGSVTLFLISEDAYLSSEAWDNYTMQCTSYAEGSWICRRTVSFSIAGTDTPEFFYFEAADVQGIKDSLGNATSSLKFKIDRTPPSIVFVSPKNNSYVSGIVNVTVDVADAVSGVNFSALRFSVNNVTWSSMSNVTGAWNSSLYADNETVTVFVSAMDNVGNAVIRNITVKVDNEPPLVSVAAPSNNQIVRDVVALGINASDRFSGIDDKSGTYVFGPSQGALACERVVNYSCTASINTSVLHDNKYEIQFTIYDSAKNARSVYVNATTKNERPVVNFAVPPYIKNALTLNVTITNPSDTVSGVTLKIEKGSSATTVAMGCNSLFTTCSHMLNTKNFADGSYKLTVVANNTLGYNLISAANTVIDNTNPVIEIDAKDVARGRLTVNARITDITASAGAVSVRVPEASLVLSQACVPQDDRLLCSAEYDSSLLADGPYTINVSATDLAGNYFSAVKQMRIDNFPPVFVSLSIIPVYSDKAANVTIVANLTDAGTSVQSASAIVDDFAAKETIALVASSGLWSKTMYIKKFGGYKVDLTASDASGNSKTFDYVGYFFVGPISCGDGLCGSSENTCVCAADCAFSCAANQVKDCGSGVPACRSLYVCGDGVCSQNETCSSCSRDCGACGNASSGQGSGTALPEPEELGVPQRPVPGKPAGKEYSVVREIIRSDQVVFVPLAVIIVLAFIIIRMLGRRRKKYGKVEPFIFKGKD